ncbi:MAG: hypothetical protein AB7P69_02750 [Candidatus Binatia bacterium]
MAEFQSLAEWAQSMAEAVLRKTWATEQQIGSIPQSQVESIWVKGMDQVTQALGVLVQALKDTKQFPQLSLISYARSPQGTTTYMRRGTLLSLRGLREDSPTLEFEIDPSTPFRADLLAPTVRVLTTPATLQSNGLRKAHWCIGVSAQGAVIWQRLNDALPISQEGSSEEILRSFLAILLRTA